MPIPKTKIVAATLRQQIVKEIRQSIVQRSLKPGERLVERELAAQLGTSLTAVRESLIQLEMEGLITKRPNAATHVVQLTRAEAEGIYEVRSVLEHHAFQQAARVASAADVQMLKQLYGKTLEAAKAGDGPSYVASDLEWHEAVWRATGNTCLVDSLRRVMLPLFGYSTIGIESNKFDLMRDAESHKPLLDAISDHDAAQAGKRFLQAEKLWRLNFALTD